MKTNSQVNNGSLLSNVEDLKAGNIPHELSQLSCLRFLNLECNNLSGIAHFNISLTFMLLINSQVNQKLGPSNGNDINEGNIPAELSQLNNLEGLQLNNNHLSGRLFFFGFEW